CLDRMGGREAPWPAAAGRRRPAERDILAELGVGRQSVGESRRRGAAGGEKSGWQRWVWTVAFSLAWGGSRSSLPCIARARANGLGQRTGGATASASLRACGSCPRERSRAGIAAACCSQVGAKGGTRTPTPCGTGT